MTRALTPEEIGAKIRMARERLGWSQAKLADMVGAAQQTIEKIELGKVKRSTYTADLFQILDIPYDRRVMGRFEGNLPYFPVSGGRQDRHTLKAVKIRREALGLSITELARYAGISENDLTRIESSDSPDVDDATVKKLLLQLRFIETQDPIGEPFAAPGVYVSALPRTGMNFPYFRMGAKKGIVFQYFAPTPFDLPRSLGGFYCLTIGSWVEGNAVAGQRIYARANPNFARRELPAPIVAIRSGQLPEDVDRVICGFLIQRSEREFVVGRSLNDPNPLVLRQEQWSLTEVHMILSGSTLGSVD